MSINVIRITSKRILFSVPSTKAKVSDDAEASKTETEAPQEEAKSCDNAERDGESCQDEATAVIQEESAENSGDAKEESGHAEEEAQAASETADSKEDEGEVNLLSQIILEKLKFLSEGKPSVSPVQMMLIQLQVDENFTRLDYSGGLAG